MVLKKSYLRCRESIWFCTALYPSFHDGHGYGRSVMVRPGHGLVRQFHFQGPIVPSQPVPLAGPCPSWCAPSNQHEVVRVRPHKPHLVAVHRHIGLMVESTHVAQSYVGHPIPKKFHSAIQCWHRSILTSSPHGSLQKHKASFRRLKQV